MNNEIPDCSPVECAKQLVRDFETSFECHASHFHERDFVTTLIHVHPGITTVQPSPDTVYFEVKDSVAENLAVAAVGVREISEAILHISKANIWNGVPVPQAFRPACLQTLNGKAFGEKKTGQTPGKRFGLFFAAFYIAHYLDDAYGEINLVRGDGDAPTSAADAVSEAFAVNNVSIKYTLVRDWLTHPKHSDNRLRALAIENRLKENLLFGLGVLRHERSWIVGPYGPFGPIGTMGRMT